MFRIFWQVWIGEIGKKDYHNAKKIKKKQVVNDGIYEELDFKYLYFLEKYSLIFQNSMLKSLIHKIKKHKNFQKSFVKSLTLQ